MVERVQVTAVVPVELRDRLRQKAREEGRTVSALAGQVLAAYVGLAYTTPLRGRRPGEPQPPNLVGLNGRKPSYDPFAEVPGELVREKFVEDA